MRSIQAKQLLLILTIFVSGLTSMAQTTRNQVDDIGLFEHGKMLYIKKLYIPAMQDFDAFIKTNSYPNLTHEATIYRELCRLKLEKRNAALNLSKLIKEYPEHKINTEVMFELGLYYFADEKYKRALKYLEDIEEYDVARVHREELIFKKGYSMFMEGNYQDAKIEFSKILNGKSQYAVQANYYYGYQCYLLKDYDCALSTFEKIGDKGPRTMRLYMAQIYYEKNDYDKAYELLKGLNIESKQDEIELLTGKIQYQLGNYDIALTHFNRFKGDIAKLAADEIYQFAHCNFLAGNFSISTKYYLMLSNREDEIGQASNYFLGVSDIETGHKERAMNAFAEAKRKNFDPKITELATFNYAKLAADLQQNNVAISSIQEFLDRYPHSKYYNEAQNIMASIYLRTKNYKAAIEVIEGIDRMDDATKKAYQILTFHRAEELYLNQEFDLSYEMFKKSLRYPADKRLEAEAYFWMGEISYKMDNYDVSINELNRFISSSASKTSNERNYAYYSMGYNYFKNHDYNKALVYFQQFSKNEKYTEVNKKIYIDNSLRLADCYFLTRQYDKAISAYDVSIDLNYKESEYALFQKGMLYGLQGKSQKKINTLKKIIKDFKRNVYTDQALFQIGNEYMNNEQYDLAESMFKLLISQHDYSKYLAQSYLKLGLIHYNQGNDDVALSYYKTVVERFPKTSSSNEALTFIEIIYMKKGQGTEWIDYANSVNANVSASNQDSILFRSAMVKYERENYDAAASDFDAYIKRFGDKGFFIVAANYYKAEIDAYKGRIDQALVHYEYVAKFKNHEFNEKANLKLATIYFEREQYEKSVEYYRNLEYVASSPLNFRTALLGQMRCYYILKDYEKSKAKAIDILPLSEVPKEDIVEAHMTLGRIQLYQNNLKTAKYHFESVVSHSRNIITAEALYHIANIQYQMNELEDARNTIYRLNDDFSAYEYWVVKGFILLADTYVKEEDYFQAKATLQSIIDNYSKEDDGILDICRMKLKEIEGKD